MGGRALASGVACLLLAISARPVRADSGVGISSPAYTVVNARTAQNQSQFYVYADMDSGVNHGFPSGLFGSSQAAMNKVQTDPGCVYSATAANGCATDPAAIDQTRGTAFRVTFGAMAPGEFAGLNFEEPQNWGATHAGTGYNLTGATQLVFDAISPAGGISVQFSIGGFVSQFIMVPQQWTTYTIDLSSLGLSQSALGAVNLLFGIGTNDTHGASGGTVLLDNIQFKPVPASQSQALGLPLANQVFGILHVANILTGNIPTPPDQINANLSTTYESSLAILGLLGRRQATDLVNAKLIADTLVYALAHDNQGDALPTAANGGLGLHNGMSNGNIALFNGQGTGAGQQGQVRLSGFTASGVCPQTGFCLVLDGASGGNNAFAVLALVAAYNQFHDQSYLNSAIAIGNWIYGNLLDNGGTGYGGYFAGYPDQGIVPKVLQTGKSTENNADIFMAFTALANAEGALGNSSLAGTWTSRANIAGDFVMQMFEATSGHFYAGTVPFGQQAAAGITPNGTRKGNDVINTFDFLDAQTFTTLALAASPRYFNSIDWRRPVQWVVSSYARAVTANGQTFQGFDLIQQSEHQSGDGPSGIAWEFTGQAVAAMQFVDALYNTSQFAADISLYLNQIRQAQLSAPYADGQGVVASTLQDKPTVPAYQQCLVTPFQCIAERVGLAATVWAIFADRGTNPMVTTAQIISPPPGSVLPTTSATFTWIPPLAADSYWLDVNNSCAGCGGGIFGRNVGLATSQTVSGIPLTGTIYARLWTQLSGVWQFNDYSYATPAKAVMSTPVQGSLLGGASVTFTWNAGTGAAAYWLDVNSSCAGCGGGIFGQNVGLATSQTVSGIPLTGLIYARLWTLLGGTWQSNDYSYVAVNSGVRATMITPTPGSLLSGSPVTFTWAAGAGASAYWLDVNSSCAGCGGGIFGQNVGLATSQTVSGIPLTGLIYARLWTLLGTTWQSNDYSYVGINSGTKGVMTTPAPGSVLGGSSVTFTWAAGAGASAYWLDVNGLCAGCGGGIFGQNVGLATSQTVNGIPLTGTIYVRLWTLLGTTWLWNDYPYVAVNSGVRATMTTPAPGSILGGPSTIFTWAAGTGASAYWLDVNTSCAGCGGGIFGRNEGLITSQLVSGLPTNGSSIYVRLWTLLGSTWQFNDYAYTAFH